MPVCKAIPGCSIALVARVYGSSCRLLDASCSLKHVPAASVTAKARPSISSLSVGKSVTQAQRLCYSPSAHCRRSYCTHLDGTAASLPPEPLIIGPCLCTQLTALCLTQPISNVSAELHSTLLTGLSISSCTRHLQHLLDRTAKPEHMRLFVTPHSCLCS